MSAFSNKTVLITGATGLMAVILQVLLKENNVKIAALSRNKEKLERNIQRIYQSWTMSK